MSLIHKTEGIIMRHADVGEADQLLTMFTKDFGKISVVARGVRLQKSKLACHLKLGSRLRVMFAENGDRLVLTDAEESENIFDLAVPPLTSPNKTSAAASVDQNIISGVFSMVDRMVQGQECDRGVWNLLVGFLDFIKQSGSAADTRALEKIFGIRFLHRLGYVGNADGKVAAVLASADWNLADKLSTEDTLELARAYELGLAASSL